MAALVKIKGTRREFIDDKKSANKTAHMVIAKIYCLVKRPNMTLSLFTEINIFIKQQFTLPSRDGRKICRA